MKHYSFNTFLVDDANREAHALCLATANLEAAAPTPVVLLGEEGSGKTHLLYAIVNQVRASSVRAGLAYVTPHNIPDQVRALIGDPSPLDRSPSAILLVDQLELADRPAAPSRPGQSDPSYAMEELGAIIRIFLDRGHRVLLASNIHPGRLRHLTPGMQQIIGEARLLLIAPLHPDRRPELLRRVARQEAEDALARQGGGAKGPLADPAAATHVAELESRIVTLEGQLETALDDARRARDEANGLLSRAQGLLEQIETNRIRFASVEAEHRQQIQDLETALAQRPSAEEVAAELDSARLEAQQAQEAAVALRIESADASSARAALEEEVQALRAALSAETLALRSERDVLRSERDALTTERDALREERDRGVEELRQFLPDLERAKSERDAALVEVDGANAARDMALAQIEDLRRAEEMAREELESLRVEAAAQVAEANAQAGELERRFAEARGAFDELRQAGMLAAAELGTLSARLTDAAETASTLAAQIADGAEATVLPEPPAAPATSAAFEPMEAPEEFSQAAFDAAFGEAEEDATEDETPQQAAAVTFEDGDAIVMDDDEAEAETVVEASDVADGLDFPRGPGI